MDFQLLLLLLIPVTWKRRKGHVSLGSPTTPRQSGLRLAFHGTREEKLAAESNEDGSLSLGRAPPFPKPLGAFWEGKQGGSMEGGLLPTTPALPAGPCSSNLPPLAVRTRCDISCISDLEMFCALWKSMEVRFQSSPQHAIDPPSYRFPGMLRVIPKAESAFLGCPLGWPASPRDRATAKPVQGDARYNC